MIEYFKFFGIDKSKYKFYDLDEKIKRKIKTLGDYQMLPINNCYNLDCIKGMKLIYNKSIGLLLTDPPYDVGYDKKSEELNKIGKGRQKQINRDKDFIESSIKTASWGFE